MQGAWAPVDKLLDEGRDGSAGSPFSAEAADLLLGGDFTSQQEPEETFGQGFRSTGGLGKSLLDIGDGVAAETDTLLSVKNGT